MLRFGSLVALVLLGLFVSACKEDAAVPTPVDGGQVTVAQVIDGDTVILEDGRHVRYLGINAPERDQPFYAEAREANRRLVEGKKAWLVLDVQPTDRYGRVLAYMWVGDQFVNAHLVRSGFANAYTRPPNVRFSEDVFAAEQQARSEEVGLWAPADIPLTILEILYDAPGPDHQDPNGEWVLLLNEGSEPIDLTGLTLKDEANHLFTFPARGLGPGQELKLYSGRGRNTGDSLYWGLVNDSVWNNDGDTAFLRDPRGRLIDSYGY